MQDKLDPDVENWFVSLKEKLEQAYLQHNEPWKQSGFLGTEERWVSLRQPVADCIDKSGTFLDIGCANGFLLECCIRWTEERGIKIDPYGLDISPQLIELARQRLPQFRDHFFVGNAMTWQPPRKFDFVRTELVYVPAEYEKQYIEFILENHLEPGGKLLIANYGENLQDIQERIPSGAHPTKKIIKRLKELGFEAVQYKDGYDAVKDRKTRIAILFAEK